MAKMQELFAFVDLMANNKNNIKITKPVINIKEEETKVIEFPKPKFDVSDFELAARQTADLSSDTMEEVIKQVKEHYDDKN